MLYTRPDQFLRGIAGGPMGVLIDHADAFVTQVGGELRHTATRTYAVVDGRAYPLLCADFVERYYPEGEGAYTEACGAPVVAGREDAAACEYHQGAIDEWRSMSEAERCQMERMEEEDSYGR